MELTSYRPRGTPQQGDQGLVSLGTKEGAPTQWGAPAELGQVRLRKLGLEVGGRAGGSVSWVVGPWNSGESP